MKNIRNLIGQEMNFVELDNELVGMGYASEFDWIGDWDEIIESGCIAYSKDLGDTHDILNFKVVCTAVEDKHITTTTVKVTDVWGV